MFGNRLYLFILPACASTPRSSGHPQWNEHETGRDSEIIGYVSWDKTTDISKILFSFQWWFAWNSWPVKEPRCCKWFIYFTRVTWEWLTLYRMYNSTRRFITCYQRIVAYKLLSSTRNTVIHTISKRWKSLYALSWVLETSTRVISSKFCPYRKSFFRQCLFFFI